ncbi:hypothetical protein [Streptomyces sp. NPDC051561]|uniref:hypothetical protein n=1 Tax=Streptomyces sp. NPDC051561 TaxID=3365658 RepID=UPI00379E3AED
MTPVIAFFCVLAGLLTWVYLVVEPSSEAGGRARADLTAHRVPASYLGLAPKPVCVTPVVPLHTLPFEGQLLEPNKVYASFGAVDGKLTLWDPSTQESFPVPAGKVRVMPAGTDEQGSAVPGNCPARVRG